jgi:D-alanyl-D-alanine carboxypeptidase
MRRKKKRKLKKKVKVVLLLLLVILVVIVIMTINKLNNKEIELNNLTIELGEDIYISDLIKNTSLTIVNKDEQIDTTKLGSQEITIKYLKNDKEGSYKVKIKVIDSEKPTIQVEDTITVLKSSNTDITSLIKVTDNSNEEITPVIKGEYDLDKVGEYKVEVVATDSSNNENTKEIVIKVIENISYNSDGSLVDGTYTTNNGYTLKVVEGIASVNDIIIVNKTYSISSTYKPNSPYKAISGGYCTDCIEDYVMKAFLKMQEDAKKLGLSLRIGSGYRSYQTQVTLYNNYVNQDGKEAADTYSARAGYSEHQTGLCFDLNSDNDTFTNTKEGKWVNENAYKYGLVIRFPKGKDEYTGYEYESWHLRYVGEELAKELYNDGDWISLEEYFGLTSKYPEN